MPLNEQEIAALKELIVDPLSEKIDLMIKPLTMKVENQEDRLGRVEATLGKFTKVYAVIVTGLTFVGHWFYGKVRKLL